MKLSDALAEVLFEENIKSAFGLQGGAVVHLFDSMEKVGIKVVYTHHEQSASLAAVANAKVTGELGCAVLTTGPGSTNAITGLLAAWQDSIPCIFISGQVRSQHTSYGKPVRQVGTQEVNICDIVRPITKAAILLKDPKDFFSEIERAIFIAKQGRPGPVWFDIPLDFQWAEIAQRMSNKSVDLNLLKQTYDQKDYLESLTYLNSSNNPLLVLGYGIRLSGAELAIKELVDTTGIPFVTTWTAADLFPTNDHHNLGIIGMSGQRGANKAVYAADLLLCVGTHLSIPQTTTLFEQFAPQAKKIIVNIDRNQLDNLNVKFDLKIEADAKDYLNWTLRQEIPNKKSWSDFQKYKDLNWYEPAISSLPDTNLVVRKLTSQIKDKCAFVIDGGGTALYAGFQSSVLKTGDRIICSSAISSMGTGLAECVGVAQTGQFNKIICIIGDGSLLMNIQDLQTIKQEAMNVVIVLINNNGYLAIRHTQKEFLGGRYYGTHPEWGLTFPDFEKVSEAFDISYLQLSDPLNIDEVIKKAIHHKGPLLLEVKVSENQESLFKQGYRTNPDNTFTPLPLSEMAPFIESKG
jgi:acetolactate synthase-1/2/3 large subunit